MFNKKGRVLGKNFVCQKNSNHSKSILVDSFFSNSHLHPRDVLILIVQYLDGSPQYKAAFQAGISGSATKVNWCSYIRDVCCQKVYELLHHSDIQFNGIVELDESLFGLKKKHGKGKDTLVQTWIFGMTERESGRFLCFPVADRSQEGPLCVKYIWYLVYVPTLTFNRSHIFQLARTVYKDIIQEKPLQFQLNHSTILEIQNVTVLFGT